MTGSSDSAENDRAGSDAVAMEIMVLDRLLYRNRSQHRSGKYFTRVVEVRRACQVLAAPKLPDLLAQGLSLIARVPDSRSGRARETWVRSAAGELRRMRISVAAIAYSLETIVVASRHLAHQVSQTYFMALSTVFLASLARLFVCNLHLGGRLLEVHGALLRTLVTQPCTSECLSASEMAECRVPAETASFLARLRGSETAPKSAQRKRAQSRSTGSVAAAAAAAPAPGLPEATSSSATSITTSKSSPGEQGGKSRGGGPAVTVTAAKSNAAVAAADKHDDEDYDGNDTGVHIGRAAPATAAADEKQLVLPSAEISRTTLPAASPGSDHSGSIRGAAVAEDSAGGRGTPTAGALTGSTSEKSGQDGKGRVGESDGSRKDTAGGGSCAGSGNRSGGRSSSRGVVLPPRKHQRKKVVLASEFSDSSSSSSSEDESEIAGVVGGSPRTNNCDQKKTPSPPPQVPMPEGPSSTKKVAGDVALLSPTPEPSPHRPSLGQQAQSTSSSITSGESDPSDLPRNDHPDNTKSSRESVNSLATPLAATDVVHPPADPSGSSSRGDAENGHPGCTSPATTQRAAAVGAGEPLGWIIDPRPSPVGVEGSSSRSGKKRRRRGGNGVLAVAANSPRGVNPAAESSGQEEGLREKAACPASAVKGSEKVICSSNGGGGGGGDIGDGESSDMANHVPEGEVVMGGVETGVDVAATKRAQGTLCEPGGGGGGGSPENAPRPVKDPAPERPATATDGECVRDAAATTVPGLEDMSGEGDADAAGVPDGGGDADAAAAGLTRDAKAKRLSWKRAAGIEHAATFDVGSVSDPELGPQAPQKNGSSNGEAQGGGVSRAARVTPPSEVGKKVKSDGGSGGGAGTKRGSSGEAGREMSERVKKPKKKKKKNGASSGGGKRNAIDDIFGSLM